MTNVAFSIENTCFDEDYRPLATSRITTNFANLARGENRQENLRNTFTMIDTRLNELAYWECGYENRYSVELEIISASVDVDGAGIRGAVPLIEVLQTTIVDRRSCERIPGIVGNNFSSYVRDYDFSIVVPEHAKSADGLPDDFGDLHGNLFKGFLRSDAYAQRFGRPPVICLSVSTSKIYHRTENQHPVLGVEYRKSEYSQTDAYFEKMGMRVRFFMPRTALLLWPSTTSVT